MIKDHGTIDDMPEDMKAVFEYLSRLNTGTPVNFTGAQVAFVLTAMAVAFGRTHMEAITHLYAAAAKYNMYVKAVGDAPEDTTNGRIPYFEPVGEDGELMFVTAPSSPPTTGTLQ